MILPMAEPPTTIRDMTHDDFDGLDEAQLTAHYDPMVEDIHHYRVRIVFIKHLLKVANNALGHLGPLSVLVVGGWLVSVFDDLLIQEIAIENVVAHGSQTDVVAARQRAQVPFDVMREDFASRV